MKTFSEHNPNTDTHIAFLIEPRERGNSAEWRDFCISNELLKEKNNRVKKSDIERQIYNSHKHAHKNYLKAIGKNPRKYIN